MRRDARFPLLLLLATLGPCVAAARPACADEADDRRLCARLSNGLVALEDAVAQAAGPGLRIVLSARISLDAEGRLHMAATTVSSLEADDFDEVRGPVLAGWKAERRSLVDRVEVATAARRQILLAQGGVDLAAALRAIAGRADDGTRRVPLELQPALRDRTAVLLGRFVQGGVPWTSVQRLEDGQLLSAEPPAYMKVRDRAARARVGRTLPEIDGSRGRWLGAPTPPRLAGSRERPLLVVLTNLACERECGPSREIVARWRARYPGLDVVTIYRETGFGRERPTLEEAVAAVSKEGAGHPAFVDPDDTFLSSLAPGTLGYPIVFLVGRDGVVAWEGAPSLLGFEVRAEDAIRAALR